MTQIRAKNGSDTGEGVVPVERIQYPEDAAPVFRFDTESLVAQYFFDMQHYVCSIPD